MQLYKKGVSPLIATVLLISFAVALGSVILNWGQVPVSTEDDMCTGLQISVEKKNDVELCYFTEGGATQLRFTIENIGSKNLDGLGVWIVGQKGTKFVDLDDLVVEPGNSFDVKGAQAPYTFDTYGIIKHVQLIPKISDGISTELCPRNFIKVEKITSC